MLGKIRARHIHNLQVYKFSIEEIHVLSKESSIYGAALLFMVRRCSYGAALLTWCGVAQLVERRLAVRQARVRFSARHHREVFPTELQSDEEMERDLGEWRRTNVLYECDEMNVCIS
jgi:hypothetical protein